MGQVDRRRLRGLAKECLSLASPNEGQTLLELWSAFGYSIWLDRSDPQCDPGACICVGNTTFAIWRKDPDILRNFIEEACAGIGLQVSFTETLRHDVNEAACTLFVTTGAATHRSAHRGSEANDCMRDARFSAMLRAFLRMIAEHDAFATRAAAA